MSRPRRTSRIFALGFLEGDQPLQVLSSRAQDRGVARQRPAEIALQRCPAGIEVAQCPKRRQGLEDQRFGIVDRGRGPAVSVLDAREDRLAEQQLHGGALALPDAVVGIRPALLFDHAKGIAVVAERKSRRDLLPQVATQRHGVPFVLPQRRRQRAQPACAAGEDGRRIGVVGVVEDDGAGVGRAAERGERPGVRIGGDRPARGRHSRRATPRRRRAAPWTSQGPLPCPQLQRRSARLAA